MDHCPNCHAPLRPGAKFCTSCGHRIADEAAAPPPSWPEPAVEPAASAWPAPQDSGASSWPAAPAPSDGWAASPVAGGWPAAPAAGGWPAPPPAAGWPEAPAPVDPGIPPIQETVALTAPEAVVEAAPAAAWPAADPVAPERPEAVVIETPAAVTVAAVAATVPFDADGDPRARAAELLQELRDLLPRLANPNGLDPAQLADILEAGVAADRTRWAGLRAVMERARDNPRDVETVLLLSQQVDEVLALVDRHEELTAAVQRAVVQLRAGNG